MQVSIAQWAPYEMAAAAGGWEELPTAADALHAAAQWAEQHGLDSLTGRTQLIITPGYRFKVCCHAHSGLVACAREDRAASLLMNTATPNQPTKTLPPQPQHVFGTQVVDALLTNFHQPASTLLLLVAAFLGGEHKVRASDYSPFNTFPFQRLDTNCRQLSTHRRHFGLLLPRRRSHSPPTPHPSPTTHLCTAHSYAGGTSSSPRAGGWLRRVQVQRVYAAALAHDYRFLSYGDSSLLIPSRFCAAPGDADAGSWQRL
jgi:hypothetical protein